MLILEIIGGLLILVVLVVVHELGHSIVARRNGVVVEEFGIGFPPKAKGWKLKNGVLFTLNWLPLGGFVKLKGESDDSKLKGSYGRASLWAKTKIMFAGVVMNYVVAVALLMILAWTGLPKIVDNQFSIPADTHVDYSHLQIVSLASGQAAEKAGFHSGDQILSLNEHKIDSTQQFITLTRSLEGQKVTVQYKPVKSSDVKTTTLTLGTDVDKGIFGAGIGQTEKIRNTWSAPITAVALTGQFTWMTLQSLGQLVANFFSGLVLVLIPSTQTVGQANLDAASASVAGPVGILGTIFPSAERAGITQLIFLTAIVSLTLAVTNALPIPALDGGRWFVTIIFRLLKKPLTKEREERIAATGFMILMALVVLITVGDVIKLF